MIFYFVFQVIFAQVWLLLENMTYNNKYLYLFTKFVFFIWTPNTGNNFQYNVRVKRYEQQDIRNRAQGGCSVHGLRGGGVSMVRHSS